MSAESGGAETILCVEDDEGIRTHVVEVLESFGFAVLVATDGVEGWELFQRHRDTIDLTVLDLAMPRMSGQELLSLIRQSDTGAKVIVTTGEPELRQLQADAVLKKPYGLSELAGTIRRVLDGEDRVKRKAVETPSARRRQLKAQGAPDSS